MFLEIIPESAQPFEQNFTTRAYHCIRRRITLAYACISHNVRMCLTDWLDTYTTMMGTDAAVSLLVYLSRAYHSPAGVESPKVTDWMQG